MRPHTVNSEGIHKMLSDNLKKHMRRKGWNKSELARNAQLFMPEGKSFGKYNVTSYTTGRSIPNPMFLEAMARALNVPPEEILPTRGYESVPVQERRSSPAARPSGKGVLLNINQWVSAGTALEVLRLIQSDEAHAG
jgi:transcriptional regulator with XRE-family HTH domain